VKTLKKLGVILALALSLSILFSACDKIKQGSSVGEPQPSVTVKPKTSIDDTSSISSTTEVQSPKPESTTNDGNKDDLNTIIATLNDNLKSINNKTITHDERVQFTTRLIENLTKLLKNRESSKLSDEELQKALDYNIVVNSKAQSFDGTNFNVRIVRYDGLPELFGTLERKWSLIQWWDDTRINVQTIIDKGTVVTDDFLIWKVKGAPTVVLTGYLTLYKPYPVFLSTLQLMDNKWEKTNLFSNNIVSNDVWNFTLSDNMVKVESKKKDEITVEMNQQKDGFVVYSEVDQKKKFEFKLEGNQITVK
jgi:hypothetical protein